MTSLRSATLALLAGVMVTMSCVDGTRSTGIALGPFASLSLVPSLSVPAAVDITTPINGVRITVRTVGSNVTLLELLEGVDPSAQEWDITLRTPVPRDGEEAVVLVELLNVSDVAEVVVWSGRIGPLVLAVGQSVRAADVQLYPGPLANLAVTDVSLAPDSAELFEGDTMRLVATLETSDPEAVPVPYWYSLDPAAVVDSTGLVLAVLAGEARIVAQVGPPADTVVVLVEAVPAPGFYDAPGNTQLVIGAYSTLPSTPHASDATGLLESKPTLTAVADTLLTTLAGEVIIEPDGSALYTPPAGVTDVVDEFYFHATTGDSALVSIALSERVWYIDAQAGALGASGTSTEPVLGWVDLSDVSGPDDIFYMASGTYPTFIQLGAGQQLIGAGSPLVVPGFAPLAAAGVAPVLHNQSAVIEMIGDGSAVRGVALTEDPSSGAALSEGLVANGVSDIVIENVSIVEPSFRGLLLQNLGGVNDVTDLTLTRTSFGFAGIGVDVLGGTGQINLDGTVDVVDGVLIQVEGTDAGSAVTFDGVYTALQGDTAIRVINVAGDVSFDQVSVGTNTGIGVALSGVTGSVDFASLVIQGTVNVGVVTFSLDGNLAIAGGSIDLDGTTAFQIGGGSGNVTYGGAIQVSRGASVRVTDKTGGTVTFSGAITDQGNGILLQNNVNTTTNFTGDLLLQTVPAADAFTALDGGAVNITGADNTIVTANGHAVEITGGTRIGAGGVRFRSIDALNPVVGVRVDDAGPGVFAITGDGTPRSGGTIAGADSVGVMLRNTANVRLNDILIDSASVAGVFGLTNTPGAALELSVESSVFQDQTFVNEFGVAVLVGDGGSANVTLVSDTIRDYREALVVQVGNQQAASANLRVVDAELVGNLEIPETAVAGIFALGPATICADVSNVRTTRLGTTFDWQLFNGQGTFGFVGLQADVASTFAARGVEGRASGGDQFTASLIDPIGTFGSCTIP